MDIKELESLMTEAADKLMECQDEIRSKKQECADLRSALTAERLRVKELEEALEPFSRFAHALECGNNLTVKRSEMPDDYKVYGFNFNALTMGDFRRARSILNQAPGKGDRNV